MGIPSTHEIGEIAGRLRSGETGPHTGRQRRQDSLLSLPESQAPGTFDVFHKDSNCKDDNTNFGFCDCMCIDEFLDDDFDGRDSILSDVC